VGDDTGLLKRVTLKLGFESLVISEPSAPPRPRKRKTPLEDVEELDEIGEEVKALKEEAVIREQVRIDMKLVGKSGEQKKDQGILYLRPSLKSEN